MFYKIFFLLLCFCTTASFAQVRDLFAEFEAEVTSSSSVQVPVSSSSLLPAVSSSSVQTQTIASSSSSAPMVSSSSVQAKTIASSSSSAPMVSSSSVQTQTIASSSSLAPVVSSSSVQVKTIASSSSLAPVVSSSSVQAQTIASSSSSAPAVSSSSVQIPMAVASSSSSIQVLATASSSSISRRDLLGPVKVSKIRGIDEMKGAYKSPRKALFMSLVIPGSGQLYVGSTTFNKVRGGVYLAIEAALWSSWYYYSVYKYNKQVSRYKDYANEHFSIGAYEQEMHNIYLLQLEDASEEANFEVRYLNNRESYCKSIYGTATTNNCYNSDNLFENDSRHLATFENVPLSETLQGMNFYDDNQFYQIIANQIYVLGWSDVTDRASYQQLGLSDSQSEVIPLGTSSYLKTYQNMRDKANDYASMQAWFFGGLILNHVISAFDAALSANAHNKLLYEEKLSLLDQMHLGSGVSFVDGFSASILAYWNF